MPCKCERCVQILGKRKELGDQAVVYSCLFKRVVPYECLPLVFVLELIFCWYRSSSFPLSRSTQL